MEPISILVFLALVVGAAFVYYKKLRYDKLIQKYSDPIIVKKILRHQFWEGQTQEQLLDALGSPVEVDGKALKSKTREVWKYGKIGKNRFNLRLTLEDRIVVGWDKKNS